MKWRVNHGLDMKFFETMRDVCRFVSKNENCTEIVDGISGLNGFIKFVDGEWGVSKIWKNDPRYKDKDLAVLKKFKRAMRDVTR